MLTYPEVQSYLFKLNTFVTITIKTPFNLMRLTKDYDSQSTSSSVKMQKDDVAPPAYVSDGGHHNGAQQPQQLQLGLTGVAMTLHVYIEGGAFSKRKVYVCLADKKTSVYHASYHSWSHPDMEVRRGDETG